MSDLEILKQLYNGLHLELNELKRAQKIVSKLQIEISERVF